jgi:hypothetical protein
MLLEEEGEQQKNTYLLPQRYSGRDGGYWLLISIST